MTVKQRQEFRIRLQKRARRVAERKLEAFEEERQAKTVIWIVDLHNGATRGRTAPGDTPRGDTRAKKNCVNLQRIVDKRGRRGKKVQGDTLEGVRCGVRPSIGLHLSEMNKSDSDGQKGRQFLGENK